MSAPKTSLHLACAQLRLAFFPWPPRDFGIVCWTRGGAAPRPSATAPRQGEAAPCQGAAAPCYLGRRGRAGRRGCARTWARRIGTLVMFSPPTPPKNRFCQSATAQDSKVQLHLGKVQLHLGEVSLHLGEARLHPAPNKQFQHPTAAKESKVRLRVGKAERHFGANVSARTRPSKNKPSLIQLAPLSGVPHGINDHIASSEFFCDI